MCLGLLFIELYNFGTFVSGFSGQNAASLVEISGTFYRFGTISRAMYSLWAMLRDGGDFFAFYDYICEEPLLILGLIIFIGTTVSLNRSSTPLFWTIVNLTINAIIDPTVTIAIGTTVAQNTGQ